MNIRETVSVISPFGENEECARFIIDGIDEPFVFNDIADIGQNYVFSGYIKSDIPSTITIAGNIVDCNTTWKYFCVKLVADSKSFDIYFNHETSYYLYHSQLEPGTKNTTYRPAIEDTEAEISAVDTKADNAQTAANNAQSTANTASGKADNAQTAANNAQSAANKAQSDIDNLEIGGRNLLLDSGVEVSNNEYMIRDYIPSSPLVAGEEYTISICVTPASGVTYLALYLSSGNARQIIMYVNGTNKQIITGTFACHYIAGLTPDDNPIRGYLRLYRFPNDGTVTDNTTIHWIKIEKGNKATDWTPAPEDVEAEIDAVDSKANENASNITTITETVTSQGTDISILQDQISSRIWQQDITTAVKNIEVGGRNYVVLGKLISYGYYNTTPTVSGNTITTNTVSSYEGINITLAVSGFKPDNDVYTLSGFIKVDGVIPSDNFFTSMPSTYGSDLTYNYYDPTTGYFTFTQRYSGNSQWLIHASTNRVIGISEVITFTKLKFEKGTVATDWTPAPEDLEGEVQNLTTQYSELNQDLNEISATVGKHETDISGTKSQLSDLTVNLDGFKSEVSETYTTKSAFDALEIGGRNLALNTSDELSAITLGIYYGIVYSVNISDLVEQYGLKNGDTLTASVYFKSSTTKRLQLRIQHYNNDDDRNSVYGDLIIPVDGENVVKVEKTFMLDTSYSQLHILMYNVDNVNTNTWEFYKCLKIEKGTKATDWTPAPEDVEAQITSAKETIIQQTNEAIALKASKTEVQEAIDSIEVGGRNLWLRTKEYDGTKYDRWIDNNYDSRQNIKPYTTINGFGVQRITVAYHDITQRVPIEPNTDYTLSAWIKWESEVGTLIFYADGSPTSGTRVTNQVGITDYKRVSVTFNSGNVTVSRCRFECDTSAPYLIYGFKLEKGTKATDWTPAPEDVDSDISALGNRVSSAEAQLNVNSQGISAVVERTTSLEKWSDNLEIGGRNLIIAANVIKGQCTNYTGNMISDKKSVTSDYIEVSPGDNLIFQYWQPPNSHEAGKNAWAIPFLYYDANKAYVAGSSSIRFNDTHFVEYSIVPDNVKYVRTTFDIPSGNVTDGGLKWSINDKQHRVKIEKGTVATDWTPAPEDVEAEITKAKAEFNVTAEAIRGEVSDTESRMTSLVQQTANEFSVQIGNIEVGGRNYVRNGDLTKVYTESGTTDKHQNLYAKYWLGYNPGIANPTTSYHAHIDSDTFGYNVYEFNESDGNRNWKAIHQDVGTRLDEGKNYRLSLDVYATAEGTKLSGGFYYRKKGQTEENFHSGYFSINTSKISVGKWSRVSAEVPYPVDFDPYDTTLYIYGYAFSGNAILYIKNISLNAASNTTDWTPAPGDINQAIADTKTELSATIDGIRGTVTGLSGQVSNLELTASGLTTRVSKTESDLANLEIGGRNLIPASRFSSNNSYQWSVGGIYQNNGIYIEDSTNYYIYYGHVLHENLIVGEQYTFSCRLATSANATYGKFGVGYTKHVDYCAEYYQRKGSPIIVEEKIVVTFTAASNILAISIYPYAALTPPTESVWMYAYDIKFEKGNKATDWTPAPEDIDSKIASTAETIIEQTNEAISLKASKKEVEEAIDGIEVGGRNLIVSSELIRRVYVSNVGAEGSDAYSLSTPYIPVKPGDNLILQFWQPENLYEGSQRAWANGIILFDSNKKYISGYSIGYFSDEYMKQVKTIPDGCYYVRVSFQAPTPLIANADLWTAYSPFKVKLEKGTVATDWTPSPEDTVAEAEASFEVTADAIRSEVTAAEGRMSTLVESTAKGLNVKIEDNTKNLANLEIGGRNLLLNSGVEVGSNDYRVALYTPSSPLVDGEEYTVSLCVTPAAGLTNIWLYVSNGYMNLAQLIPDGTNKQILKKTFICKYYDGRTPDVNILYADAQLYRYPNDGTVTGNTTIHWIKIEKGNRATDWTPAPEDVDGAISSAKTEINATIKGITSTVSGIDGRLTAVEQTAEDFTVRIGNTENELANLEIGGRNLVEKSEDERTFTNFYQLNTSSILADYIGRTITVSFDIRLKTLVAGSNNIILYGYQSNGISIPANAYSCVPTTTYKRHSFTTIVKDWGIVNPSYTSGGIAFYDQKGDNVYDLRRIKIELGNRATDWTPAPEDIDSSISAVDTKANNAQTAANSAQNMANAANSNANKAQSTANTANTNATTAQTAASNASSKADTAQSTANAASGKADAAQSAATNAQTTATNAAKTATNYLNFSQNGLCIGDHTAGTLGKNVLIGGEYIEFRNNTNTLARYGANKIQLGLSSDTNASVSLCGDEFIFGYDTEYTSWSVSSKNELILKAPKDLTLLSYYSESDSNTLCEINMHTYATDNISRLIISNMSSTASYTISSTIDVCPGSLAIHSESSDGYASRINLLPADKRIDLFADKILSNGEFRTTNPNGFRIMYGGYGSFIRNDGDSTYFLLTNQYDDDGSWNGLRPLIIKNSTGDVTINSATINSYGDITPGRDLVVKNGYSIFSKNTAGSQINLLHMNSSNVCVLGYGAYLNGYDLQIMARHIYMYSSGANANYKPYYNPGDSITVHWRGAGYITDEGKALSISIPLSKPAVGCSGFSVQSVGNSGLRIRQGGKYLYGGNSNSWVQPSSYSTTYIESGNYVRFVANFGNSTNVQNNDSAGVQAEVIITFY